MLEALALLFGLVLFGELAGAGGSEADWIARILASEAGGQSPLERVALAYAILNKARHVGKTVAALSNGIGPQGPLRPWSTRKPPSGFDRQVAAAVTARYPAADPTGGATKFFEPALQDRLYAEGRAGYHRDADALRAKWEREGGQRLATVGRWEFWT
jgi:hypothetical protein